MNENIVIGQNGFIAKKLSVRNSKYIFTTSNKENTKYIYLNLLDAEGFDYSRITSKTNIIFLAAISSPDECNHNYDHAYSVNVIGTKYFIENVLKKGANVLFFSSDVVYGSSINEVDESSKTNPFGTYAKMKDEVEKAFAGDKNFKVFRLSYVLSNEDKYLSYLSCCVNENKTADVFHPFYRKVVYIEDVLTAIEQILLRWDEFKNQEFNICGSESISRKDMAEFYNNEIGNKLKHKITEPDEAFWKARPKNINVVSLYLENLLNRKPVKISDAMHKMIQGEMKDG